MPFLDELSTGIFNRMKELRDEQATRDAAAQRNTIAVLSDLYGKVRPESQGVILDQLGKAIGVKGKMKSFWQALSGMPDRSIEDQLGTQLRELSAMSISPQQAKSIESKADIARMFGAESPLSAMFKDSPQAKARQAAIGAEKGLAGKLIFRDPRQEKLDEIEQRYAAQTEAALQKSAADKALANKYQVERDAANRKGRIDLAFTNQILNSQRPQLRRAYQLWHQDYLAGATPTEPDPTQYPPQAYMAAAAAELDKDIQLGRRKTEAQIKALGNQGTEKPMTAAQKAQLEQELTTEAQKLVTSVGTARTSRNTAIQKRDSLKKQLDDYAKSKGLTFDPNSGLFLGDDMAVARAGLMLEIQSGNRNIPKEYLTAKDEAEKAESALQTEFGKLKDKRYQNRVRIGKSADEEVTIIPQRGVGTKPPPATRGGDPATAGARKILKVKIGPNTEGYQMGQQKRYGRFMYEVRTNDGKEWTLELVGPAR